jgi:predicted TPR repeat methyltransferase
MAELGKILKRVWDLQAEIIMILESKCEAQMFSQLKDENWKTDLAFPVDIMRHLGILDEILQATDTRMHVS